MNFTSKLISWYKQNKRELPWRSRKDPYAIWLSEIILQQTRIDQGLAYYEAFIENFPTVFDLAKAEEQTVLKLWQGLGYYSRARNLHHTSKVVVEELNGIFPESHRELLRLKGIGDYTASAISSICHNEPQPVVDGNVFRVLSRVFGIETPIDTSAGQKEFKALAQELIDIKQPGEFNQALMEFGAIHCTPKKPQCEICTFQKKCVAFQLEKVDKLPVKKGKTKVQNRYYNYLVVVSADEKTFLEKRTIGIWKNLYQFPLIEKEAVSSVSIIEVEKLFPVQKIESVTLYNDKPVIHKLSHRNLYVQFWVVYASALEAEGIPVNKINDYPVPVVIQNFIESFTF
jgi:A/G-specific adenine glycosylase